MGENCWSDVPEGLRGDRSQDTRGWQLRTRAQVTPIGTGESCWEMGGWWESLEVSFILSVKQEARLSSGSEEGRRILKSEEEEEENSSQSGTREGNEWTRDGTRPLNSVLLK